MTFDDLQLEPNLVEGLKAMGFQKPSPIQEQAIPVLMAGKDLIACAQTGTGKTAAFLLPVLHKLASGQRTPLNTLIIAPTRELALQIDQQVEALGYFTGISSAPVYGGGDGVTWEQQKRALEQGADIIIATPGRLISMLMNGNIRFNSLQHLILDEADRLLDMGFSEDIERIVSYLPKDRQTIMFSATMPPKIRSLATRILRNPEQINIAVSKPAEGILQLAYSVYDNQKLPLLKHILHQGQFTSSIIFASTKDNVKKLEAELKRNGVMVKAFHSDLEQAEREEIMRQFKNKQLPMLLGTDILSRGIDVEGISLVLNYDCPGDPEDYIHRIGRTARAETTGTAITFVNEQDQPKFYRIENLIGKTIEKPEVPSSLGKGPLYEPDKKRSKSFHSGPSRGKKNFSPSGGNKKFSGKKPGKPFGGKSGPRSNAN